MRSVVVIAFLALGCGSGDDVADKEQAQPYITIVMRPDRAELAPGEKVLLKILLNGDGGPQINGEFRSNNEGVATVEENTGIVHAIARGTVMITGHYGPGTAYASITVK